jgi:hypothetical protein
VSSWARAVAEVELLEVETRLAEVEAGLLPVDARRDLLPHERRARVLFGQLDREVEDAAGIVARRLGIVRAAVVEAVRTAAADGSSPFDAVERLRRLADPLEPVDLPGVRQAVEDALELVVRDLYAAAFTGGESVRAEGRRQGVRVPELDADAPLLAADAREALVAAARRAVAAPVGRLLAVAAEEAGRVAPGATTAQEVGAAAVTAAEGASTAGELDAARQAASTAHGLGRTAAVRTAPVPAEVYASELLDRNTCEPCGRVDGRTYTSLSAALEDYPGAGGHVFCEGGARCRGTLVYVWDEAEAGRQDVDRTPRGPIDPPVERPFR